MEGDTAFITRHPEPQYLRPWRPPGLWEGSSCSGFLTRRAIGTATSWDHSWNCQLERRPRQPQPGPGDVCWGRGVGQWTGGPAQETDAPNPVTRPGDPAGGLSPWGPRLCSLMTAPLCAFPLWAEVGFRQPGRARARVG